MEPLAAVALAGNVLQFAEFVGRLFQDTSRIYLSASGLTPDNLHIQDICGKLGSFSTKLQSAPSYSSAPQDLRDCAAACKKDCDDLHALMKVLAARKGKSQRYWKSFSAALSHKLKAREIQDLKSRIEDHQNLMSLMLSEMLNERIRLVNTEVSQLQSTITNWTDKTAAWFQMLSDTQQHLNNQVQTLIRHESKHHMTIESICSGLKNLSINTRECQQTMDILNPLDYEERPKRHSNIPEAHPTTFSWGLQQDKPGEIQGPSGSFRRWLIGNSNLFWVSGKPGSGKSTFMKFVAGHNKTRKYLQQWAGKKELILAGHFFTIHGTSIQRSLDGLFRSLLHNILEGEPKLIPKLLPTRWTNTSKQPQWTQSELESALRTVAKMDLSVHMCFFIDGLDEYSGDHLEICQTLKELSESLFIKVCVSSRPWNVFEDAFGNSRESKLYMHELTHKDILNYTQARLSEHPRWGFVSGGPDTAASQSLIDEIVDKAMGVFLWVSLVTRLLREGLTNDDSVSDLRRRVSSCPDDLEKFFKHILAYVEPFYHEKMANTLMIARDAVEPLDVKMFVFHDHEYDDEDYALHDPTDDERTNSTDYEQKSISVARRINGRCRGLLELQGSKMVFLHRTVYDFLHTPGMAKFLREKVKVNFCSYLSLLRAQIAWFKRVVFIQVDSGGKDPDLMKDLPTFVHSLRAVARYAHLASKEGGDTQVAVAALLDNAELGITKMVRTNQIPAQDISTVVGVYRLLILESGNDGYVYSKLSIPGYLSNPYTDKHHSPLSFVFGMVPHSPNHASRTITDVSRRRLERLLQSGCDPNKVFGEDTFWTRFVQVSTRESGTLSHVDMFGIALKTGILETLLRHGADPTACVSLGDDFKAPFWFRLLFIALDIHSHQQPEFERIWDLTVERIPNLSRPKFLERVLPAPTSGSLWASHDLCPYGYTSSAQWKLTPHHQNQFILRLLVKILERVHDSRAVFQQCWDWFGRPFGVPPYEIGQAFPNEARIMYD